MCKHVPIAQVSIFAPCCGHWYDCAECHKERENHEILRKTEMILGCKKCKHVFKLDLTDLCEENEYCPNCDNHFLLEMKERQEGIAVQAEFEEERIDSSHVIDNRDWYKDRKMKERHEEARKTGQIRFI